MAFAPMAALALVRLMTSSDPGAEPYSTSIDTRVLLFTLAVSIVTSLLFSVAPVFHFLRPDLAQTLRQNTGTATRASQRFRKIAVGAQIALSVLLLGGAGQEVSYAQALRSCALQWIAAAVELVAIGSGLNERILKHRAGPLAPAVAERWQSVWEMNRKPAVAAG